MVLYLIGLGLGDENDITLKGLQAVRSCSHVFLEHYTAILTGVSTERLQSAYNISVPIVTADREMVESRADQILTPALHNNVAFLVIGDPFAATTHHDLFLRASSAGIPVEVVHNASIVNAVGAVGLQLYAFGQIVSIPFFKDSWRPDSFYDKIHSNTQAGLHTLCLLDIKVKEQSPDNMAKGVMVYEDPRYMTVNQCIEQLLEVEERRKEGGPLQCPLPLTQSCPHALSPHFSSLSHFPLPVYTRTTNAFGVARVGQSTQKIVSGTLEELLSVEFGPPLHSLVLAGELHFIEKEMFEFYHWNKQQRTAVRAQEKADEEQRQREVWDRENQERKAGDEQRKREFAQRKEKMEEKQRLDLLEAQQRSRTVDDRKSSEEDEEDGVDLEPLF